MANAQRYRWTNLTEDRPMDRIARRRIIGANMMISRVELAEGFAVDTHAHDNEQFACVLAGEIEFGLIDDDGTPRTVVCTAGDVLHIPSNVPHSARALQDTIILDLFSPPSETTGVDRARSECTTEAAENTEAMS